MQTKELNEVFKAAQKVTSLGTTDYVSAVDANGTPVSISASNLLNQNSITKLTISAGEEGWLRIANLGNYGGGCIIGVTMIGFNSGWHFPLFMAVSAPHGGSTANMAVVPLSFKHTASTNAKWPFSKIRITGREQYKYLDIYVTPHTASRSLRVALGANLDCSLMAPAWNPAEETNTKEFAVSDLWGGVIHCLSVICAAYTQKGGRRDYERAYQQPFEGETDGRYGVQKHPIRLGYTNDSRDILHGCKYRMRESSNRFGQLLEVRRRRSILSESTNISATVLPKWMRTEVDFARWHNPSLDGTWFNSLLACGKEVAA